MSFTEAFSIQPGDIIAITGGGGKTSLMFHLARELAEKGSVLVTTTTKIFAPKEKFPGITVTGKLSEDCRKFTSLDDEQLEALRGKYDYILMEADGSKMKPMKWWRSYEPVIPNMCTKVIGVINIAISYGKVLDEGLIHRYSEFAEHFELKGGEILDAKFYIRYLKEGKFFDTFKGERFFYFNGIENLENFSAAAFIASEIEPAAILGSIRKNEAYRYKKTDAVVMASGFSRRMGKNKLTMEMSEGKRMIDLILEKLENLPFNQVSVVGRELEKVIGERSKKFEYIENKRAHLGQSESVKIGVEHSRDEGIAFFPGDQPYLTEESIMKLIWEFQWSNKITMPSVEGERFSPVFFPEELKSELLKLEGDTGGREVIRKNIDRLNPVSFKNSWEFTDIDTQGDTEIRG